ncbi:hypothetical protein [Massilia rhizosphaerae]|uniref:hypothetical protein n=1 Tax=Massilia rhizosphaerae TaxID=2784389 RepID=UPI0018DD9A18|nr:hypothetical protein [Massilia rhizosphaerae]
MIVTIVHAALPAAGAALAENLALLRGRHGRKVLLLDAGAERMREHWSADRDRSRLRPAVTTRTVTGRGLSADLERFLARYDDIVIEAGDGNDNSPECRRALIAAEVALILLAPEDAGIDARHPLIARLNGARMFNPGLRVLFVAAGGEHDPAPEALAAMRTDAARVMSAGVAHTVLHLPALSWGAGQPGRCASDIESSTGAAEMTALYDEVYQADAPQVVSVGKIF